MVIGIREFDLQKIADSGQCFRMRRRKDGSFGVVAGGKYLQMAALGDGAFDLSCTEEAFPYWAHYFDLQTDYGTFSEAADPDDVFLRDALLYGKGLRILNQDPWEVTVSFILSQRKSLGAIRTAVEALCRRCGTSFETDAGTMYAFPTPGQLSGLASCDLRDCSVGYRDKYIGELARRVSTGEVSLDAIRKQGDADAKKALLGLYGVGSKVADCILLFGYRRTDAFPVDVWIQRVIDEEYGGAFPVDKYAGFAGILQQYLFYYAKSPEYGYAKRKGKAEANGAQAN